jgi:hypothetical protein
MKIGLLELNINVLLKHQNIDSKCHMNNLNYEIKFK